MQIKGYISLHCYYPPDRERFTFYKIFTLERVGGELYWTSNTLVTKKLKPAGLIHITSFHGHPYPKWSTFCEMDNFPPYTMRLKYEEHHLNRVWCKDLPAE